MPQKRNSRARSAAHADLGKTVRLLRAERSLSQEQLGERCGLHRNYVGAIERGEINSTFRVLLMLAHGLQVPLSRLVALYERRHSTNPASAHRDLIGRPDDRDQGER